MGPTSEDRLADFTLHQRALFARLGWFIGLRWIAVLAILLGLMLHWHSTEEPVRMVPVLLFCLAVLAYNAVFTVVNHYLHRKAPPSRLKNIAFIVCQIACDLTTISIAVHATGGIHSVFIVCYALPLVVASILLRKWTCLGVTLATVVLVNAIYLLESFGLLPYHPMEGFTLGFQGDNVEAPPFSPIVSLVLSLTFCAISYVGSSISGQLRGLEHEVEAINRELLALNRSKSEFLRMTNHELRSPLAAVQGLLEVLHLKLSRRHGDEKELIEILERASRRCASVQELVHDLLNYSRLQTVLELERESGIDLRAIVDEVLEEVEPLASRKDILVEPLLEPCEMTGKPDDLVTLVKNLVFNAVRYTPRGGQVEVQLRQLGRTAVLRVSDNGIGIDEESLKHLYEEFFRAPNARDFETAGTGLGLTLCKTIVEDHQGAIECQSVVNQGTCFTVTLPLDGKAVPGLTADADTGSMGS